MLVPESEVLKRLEDVTGQAQLRLDIDQVNPSQFLGIEINPRAAAIADLVLWIGYLQWHFRHFGDLPLGERWGCRRRSPHTAKPP
jgi:hypothetical protein